MMNNKTIFGNIKAVVENGGFEARGIDFMILCYLIHGLTEYRWFRGGSFLRTYGPDNKITFIDVDDINSNSKYFNKDVVEGAKIIFAASEILKVDIESLFVGVDMTFDKAELLKECNALRCARTCGKKEEAEKKEKELKDKADEFHRYCLGEGEMLGSDYNLNSKWTHDTSFLRYVDCAQTLRLAMISKRSQVIEELIKINKFEDVLTINNYEILKHAINNVIECEYNQDDYLRTFCLIVTSDRVRKELYHSSDRAMARYFNDTLQKNSELYKDGNIRDMMFILYFLMYNRPDDDDDMFYNRYKDALLKDILQ